MKIKLNGIKTQTILEKEIIQFIKTPNKWYIKTIIKNWNTEETIQ